MSSARPMQVPRLAAAASLALVASVLASCQSPATHRERADAAAQAIIEEVQAERLGRTEPVRIETSADTLRRRLLLGQDLPTAGPASLGTQALEDPEHWPELGEPDPDLVEPPHLPEGADAVQDGLTLSLVDALQVAARNSRSYQDQKEAVFETALSLDLERYRLETTFGGLLRAMFRTDEDADERGVEGTAELSVNRRFEAGAQLGGRLVVDLAHLLTNEGGTSLGLLADGSITVPLLRGSGRHIVTEPRTQAQRNVLYQLFSFERFRRTLVVEVAQRYYAVLQQLDRIRNAEENYRRLVILVRRTDALEAAGRVTGIQVDQARQDLLRARERWIAARETYGRQLDQLKMTLGLPTDASIELVPGEFDRLIGEAELMFLGLDTAPVAVDDEQVADEALAADAPVDLPEPDPAERGRYELDEAKAIALALEHRLDLRTAVGRVFDAQRGIIVAADDLRMGLDLIGQATVGERRSIGSAGLRDARLDPAAGVYSAGLEVDLPWDRRTQRLELRRRMIDLQQAVRDVQELEDEVKLDVRDALRDLLEQRENYRIQVQAQEIAERRVEQAEEFLRVGRADVRDVLEANEALIQAQNALVDALIAYRISELGFQRDVGMLRVDERGLWEEFDPHTPFIPDNEQEREEADDE
ncbi:MAG: TolC family protein [Phycisphaeraceae bacterium]